MKVINKSIRLIELFSGYGSQYMALKTLAKEFNVPICSYKTCEWEASAIRSYKALHFPNDNTNYSDGLSKEELIDALYSLGVSNDGGKNPMTYRAIKIKKEEWLREVYNNIKATHNLVDITKVHGNDLSIKDTNNYEYIVTYSFPCQSLSLLGKRAGMEKGSGTRSGLLWEFERILDEIVEQGKELPQILVMENVPQVHSKSNMHNFNAWIDKLKILGYSSYYKDMNAKDYGVPQRRVRCIMVSLLGGGTEDYKFPEAFSLSMTLGDVLEDSTTQKYADNGYKYTFEKVFDRGDVSEF
jgi:DNA (cytosine-5)-methyltransferase 1